MVDLTTRAVKTGAGGRCVRDQAHPLGAGGQHEGEDESGESAARGNHPVQPGRT